MLLANGSTREFSKGEVFQGLIENGLQATVDKKIPVFGGEEKTSCNDLQLLDFILLVLI